MNVPPSTGGYLVLHRGSRWTDVFRLNPPTNPSRSSPTNDAGSTGEILIGRASSNPIVLKSGRASRRHARVFFQTDPAPGWFVEDLASRNGVRVNGRDIEAPVALREGDRLEIAGFEMSFTHDLARDASTLGKGNDNANLADDQPTQGELDWPSEPSECLDIVARSSGNLMANVASPQLTPATADRALLQMAFAMGRADHAEQAAERLLETLAEQIPESEIGIYLDWTIESLRPPKYVHQRPGQRYRRPPETLIRQISSPPNTSLLARNVIGDPALATENTQGIIDVESIIMVPLIDPSATPVKPFGFIHITATAGDIGLTNHDLALVVTAGEIYCEAQRSLRTRLTLKEHLDQSNQTIRRLRQQISGHVNLLGRSESIRDIQIQISRVAASNAAVLLRGESGSGKELVASAIHHASPRAGETMVCLNCAALSKDLLESELFGHEQGAFTGATQQKRGKFETASGGTLMLDEIGEMSLDLQAKLLRVLEGHAFERVGGHESIRADVRIIAATHRDLRAMVQDGTFRQDLYYRLNVVEIIVPPLRQRGRDVILLAEYFVKSFTRSMGRRDMKLSPAATKKLLDYTWPGNVRELRNVIERAVVLSPLESLSSDEEALIQADQLLLSPAPVGPLSDSSELPQNDPENDPLVALADLERKHIERVLRSTGGNKSQASSILGIERSTLDRKLKRYAKTKPA